MQARLLQRKDLVQEAKQGERPAEMILWKKAGCQTKAKAFEKSIVKRIVLERGLGKGSARGNWEPREGQQPFRVNPNGVGDPNHVEAAVD